MKRNASFLHQRRNKEIYKLPYMEDFEANKDVSEDNIFCSSCNVQGMSTMIHMPLPKSLFIQNSVILHHCSFKSAIK